MLLVFIGLLYPPLFMKWLFLYSMGTVNRIGEHLHGLPSAEFTEFNDTLTLGIRAPEGTEPDAGLA
jgi:hypothetical protein